MGSGVVGGFSRGKERGDVLRKNNDSNNLGRQVDFFYPSPFFGIPPRETVFGKTRDFARPRSERYLEGFPFLPPRGRGWGSKREHGDIRMGEEARPSANLHPEPADSIDPKKRRCGGGSSVSTPGGEGRGGGGGAIIAI